ncbi:MAG: hypothetical protein PSX36_01070 [bacterium]|nr:hypothetical protein [bacterium]
MKNTYKQKKTKWVILFSAFTLLLPLSYWGQNSAPGDSIFISSLVKFYQSRCGNSLKGDLYQSHAVDSPYIYVYVSPSNKVENALKNSGYFLFCNHNMKKALHYDSLYSDVNECFIYTTAANASTRLTSELLQYRKETQAFIVFHELTHVLLNSINSKLTYTVNEAVCDVVGNYLCREYALSNKALNLKVVDAQIQLNEHLYNLFNSTILRINSNANQKPMAVKFLSKELSRTLVKADAFQKQRFNYPVNNAYLLKNSFYSENYYFYKQKLVFNRQLPPDLRDILKK